MRIVDEKILKIEYVQKKTINCDKNVLQRWLKILHFKY